MSKSSPKYEELNAELEAIIQDLNDETTSIDEAIKKYEKAQRIISQLDKYLKTSEAKINKLKKSK